MKAELIIIEKETSDIGYPIASVLTMERAMKIVEESKGWPLPWTAEWKRTFVQGNVVPKHVTKRKGGKR